MDLPVLRLHLFPHTEYCPVTQNPLRTIGYLALPWLVIGLTTSTSSRSSRVAVS